MIGLLGGTFDPPHDGHVALAEAARRELGLDQLVVLVVADPGHRTVTCDVDTRLELARAAFPDARVVREDHRFTVDSVRDDAYGDAVFLVGADQFADFLSWKEPDEILEHVRVGVATRPGFPRERLEEVLAHLRRPERVIFFENEPVPVSSTDIRERVRKGEPIDALVPPAVAELVTSRGIYRRLNEVE